MVRVWEDKLWVQFNALVSWWMSVMKSESEVWDFVHCMYVFCFECPVLSKTGRIPNLTLGYLLKSCGVASLQRKMWTWGYELQSREIPEECVYIFIRIMFFSTAVLLNLGHSRSIDNRTWWLCALPSENWSKHILKYRFSLYHKSDPLYFYRSVCGWRYARLSPHQTMLWPQSRVLFPVYPLPYRVPIGSRIF